MNLTAAALTPNWYRAITIILALLVLLALLPGEPLAAAEAESVPPASAPPVPADASTSGAPQTGAEKRRAGDKGGVFRPSEDISEDLAVTFPVDI